MPRFFTPAPHEVFTPGDIPLDDTNVYVTRATSEQSLTRAIQRNWCPVVYGDYGVGKTTLVLRYFRKEKASGRLLYIESASGLSMPDLFEAALEHLDYRVEVETVKSRGGDGGVGFDAKILQVNLSRQSGKDTTTRLVVSSPTDQAVLRIIDEARLIIAIDEMHAASEIFRAELASFIKVSRIGARNSTLVLIGTSADPQKLVSSDPGIDRFVKDTRVSLMSDKEATQLITDGFQKLKIQIDDALVSEIVAVAAGAPSILQTLCLDIAESALERREAAVNRNDLSVAVKRYLDDNSGRMTRKYFTAIETQGDKRYRKQILHAIASLPGEYATMEDLRAQISARLGENVPAHALSGPLRQLKTDPYGSILQDVTRESGGAIQNVTSFTDPMMKSFVRFMGTLADTQIVNEDDVREGLSADQQA